MKYKVDFLIITDENDCKLESGYLAELPQIGGRIGRGQGDRTNYYLVLDVIPLALLEGELQQEEFAYPVFEVICASTKWPVPELYRRVPQLFPVPQEQDSRWQGKPATATRST